MLMVSPEPGFWVHAVSFNTYIYVSEPVPLLPHRHRPLPLRGLCADGIGTVCVACSV
jgi:hypothetical protein